MRNVLDAKLILDAPALRKERERVEQATFRAARGAVAETTKDAERALEDVTRQAVGGNLWRAWNSKVYPEGGRLSDDPTGFIYPKGAKGGRTEGAIRSLVEGGRIGSADGGWLAIPLEVVGRRGWAGGRGNWVDMTPAEWERRNGQQLDPVKLANGHVLLVAKANINAAGRIRRATARQIDRMTYASVPIFVLVPYVKARGGMSIVSTLRPFEARLVQNFEARAPRE